MGEAPSGTVTFLFTDIEGSSRLWEAHPETMSDALATHDALLRDAVETRDGYVVKTTGDGLFAAFGRAEAALTAALEAQQTLGGAAWGVTGPLRVRMGLHTGDADFRDGDYHGPALNRAARLMSAGHGGQVLLSSATAALVGERLPEGAELVALGEHRLRDLGRPEVLYQLIHPRLIRSFPPLRTLESFPGNLPLQVSSFIGRDREVARTLGALDEARIVTLTGVGGVGKTRLALQVAAAALPRFREGAWLVELAPVRDPGGVAGALAAVFGINARAGLSLEESLAEFLRTKQLLLVLDNCEHLLEPVAELVEMLERSCAGLVVLATSREGLALDGERVLPIPSLKSPPMGAELDEVAESDAVRLFVERASAVDPEFFLGDHAAAVVSVCQRLDGVPLAIELAAARVTAMTPAELERGLNRRFETLAGGRRRAVQRHQTLRAAIDWSYDLLSEAERSVLARLAVFAGGCTRQAAEAVCAGAPIEKRQVFDLLVDLVNKSLVVAQRDGPDTRYRLLETIREYGEERLADHGETEALRSAHAEYYCGLAVELYAEMFGPAQIETSRRFTAEHENLLAAMSHAIDTEDVHLALRLVSNTPFGNQTGLELLLPLDAVLALPGVTDHPLYPLALGEAAIYRCRRGQLTDIEAVCQEALATNERLGPDPDHRVESNVAVARASAALAAGSWADAARYEEQAAEIARSSVRPGDRYAVAVSLNNAAACHLMAGNAGAAAPLAAEGLELARRVGAPEAIAMSLVTVAGTLADRDGKRARSLLEESLELRSRLDFETLADQTQGALVAARMNDRPITLRFAASAIRHLHWSGDRPFLAGILNVVASTIADVQPEAAAVLQGAARRITTHVLAARGSGSAVVNPPGVSFLTELRRAATRTLRDALGDDRLRQLWAEGDAMDEDHAVAFALEAIAKARPEGA